MTFDVLYGIELDRELVTADRDQRFTTVRRKAAINAGQLEFVKRTECFTRQTTVTIADATQEYDLEATIAALASLSKPVKSMRPCHRALVYFAAFDLEKFRKDVSRQQSALQLFELEVQKYLGAMKPKNGSHVRFAKNYRAMQGSSMTPRRYDPRA